MRIMFLLPALALIAGPLLAQTVAAPTGMPMADPKPCPAAPLALPPALAGFGAGVAVKAAVTPGELSLANLALGRGVRATLSPTERVAYPVTPGHPGEPGTTGGLLAFTVERAGTYRVALGAGAWIDVVRDGHAVESTAHGHGPACGPIRKTVDFTLTPGRYVLQLSNNKMPTLALMIAPLLP